MRALSHLCTCMMQYHVVDLTVAMDLDLCPAVLLIAKGETNILETSGKTATACSGRWTMVHGRWSNVGLIPPKTISRRFNALHYTDRTRRRRTHAHRVAVTQCVLQ